MPHGGDGETSQSSPFEELLRLQSSFQQSLTDATMNYLRQLQGLVGPVTPGTVVQRASETALAVRLAPGGAAEVRLTVENRQRVHSMVTPMLSPLVSDTGATWFAEAAFDPPTALLATDEEAVFTLKLMAPDDVPLGVYRGAALLYGCAEGVVPFEVTVARPTAGDNAKPGAKPRKRATQTTAKTTAKSAAKTTAKTTAKAVPKTAAKTAAQATTGAAKTARKPAAKKPARARSAKPKPAS